MIADSGEMK